MKQPSATPGLVPRPTVICLHSSGATGAQWSTLRDRLEPDLHVLTPDFHGHGSGDAWHGIASDIVAADTLRVARLAQGVPGGAHLVGHSYGAAIAMRVALHHPGSVRSVVAYEPVLFRALFDHYGRRRPAAEIDEIAQRMRARLASGDGRGAANAFVDYWGGMGAWSALSERAQTGVASRIQAIAAHFTGLARDVVRLDDFRALRRPVLLLRGRDTRTPMRRLVELLVAALPEARVEILDGLGHLGPITHAAFVAGRVETFLHRHRIGGAVMDRRLAA